MESVSDTESVSPNARMDHIFSLNKLNQNQQQHGVSFNENLISIQSQKNEVSAAKSRQRYKGNTKKVESQNSSDLDPENQNYSGKSGSPKRDMLIYHPIRTREFNFRSRNGSTEKQTVIYTTGNDNKFWVKEINSHRQHSKRKSI